MKIGDYDGPMLSHVNAIHRPEDRALADAGRRLFERGIPGEQLPACAACQAASDPASPAPIT